MKQFVLVFFILFYSFCFSQTERKNLDQLRSVAESGNLEAQFYLAYMYENAVGTLKDYKEAVKWYLKSAEQGNVDAQYNLASMYYKGLGVVQNYEEAIKWYEKASIQEHFGAQLAMGKMLFFGLGSTKDIDKAKNLIRRAYENGSDEAEEFWNQNELYNY